MTIVEIKEVVSKNTYIVESKLGKKFKVVTDTTLLIGESVLLVNGVVVSKVKTTTATVYEV